MKPYISLFTLVLVVIISLSSCKTKENISTIDVKVNDTITVILKDTIVVDLVSNPSTGYRWTYTENSAEKNVKFVSDVFAAPKTEMVGKAGTQTFSFLANKKGATILEFNYARGTGTPANTYRVWVIVNKK
jgi:inhibitor of cysteine peptidase